MKHLKLALEALNEPAAGADNATVTLVGPLADAYTKALQIALKRETDPKEDPIPAMESQQQDADTLRKILDAINGATNEPTQTQVYCTGASQLSADEFVDITTRVLEKRDGEELVFVIDGMQPGEKAGFTGSPGNEIVRVAPALEAFLNRMQIKHYASLADWAKELGK